jgi:hypothetical protein
MNLCDEPGKEIRQAGKRRLVEECEKVAVGAVQRAFGKRILIEAIRRARPIRLPVLGGEFDLWLIAGPHHLPHGRKRCRSLDNGLCRLWLICPGCKKTVARLFYYFFSRDSLTHSDLLCRGCHGLTYQSKNCSGNHWYEQVARPLKRLLSEKRRLLVRTPSPRNVTRLAEIDRQVSELTQKLQPKTQRQNKFSRRLRSGRRRPYRDLSLFGVVSRRDRLNTRPDRLDVGPNSALLGQKTYSAAVPGPRETNGQLLDEDSRYWLDAISEFRNKGLITDDHLRRSPELRRALEIVHRE